jgi:uncharacterized protein with HEPN domain
VKLAARYHPTSKPNIRSFPWRDMNDIRNKIIHHYFGVDYDIVWDTVISNIPNLKESIEVVMKTEKAG